MADNQDPLAALQKLLEEQKKQGAVDTVPEEKAPGLSAEEIALLQQQKQAEDQVQINEQLAKMQAELKDTPQYQARMSQKISSEALSEQKKLEERSIRIFQLKHLESN